MATEAEKLRELADDVRALLDEPAKLAASRDWAGPNAEKVRGELRVRKKRLNFMAESIEREAGHRKEDKPN